MVSRAKDERAHVNELVKAIQKNSPGVYVFIDRDAGNARHTSSGWDFLLAFDERVIFCEAKEPKGKLSDWQEFTRSFIRAAGCQYSVVRFWREGTVFSVDDGPMIEVYTAKLSDFIEL